MTKKCNCYKVVLVDEDGRMFSIIADEPARVEYALNTPVTGKEGTPLFAFSSLEGAMSWARRESRRKIYRAVGKGRVRKPRFILDWITLERFFIRFWNGVDSISQEHMQPVPNDTVFYRSIELVEKVEIL